MPHSSALIDSNVIIDALTSREGAVEQEREILRLAASKRVSLCISAKQITDIHYVLRKHYPEESRRRAFIELLLRCFEVLPLTCECLSSALDSPDADYEDAVLSASCIRNGISSIVTNDAKGFAKSGLTVYTPTKFIESLQ